MIKDTSKETFDRNLEKFNTDKANVLCFLLANADKSYTASQIAENTAVSYRNTMSRLTDLQNEGKVKVTGKRTERGRRVQTYQYDPSGKGSSRVTWKEAYEKAIKEAINGSPFHIGHTIIIRAEQIKNGL